MRAKISKWVINYLVYKSWVFVLLICLPNAVAFGQEKIEKHEIPTQDLKQIKQNELRYGVGLASSEITGTGVFFRRYCQDGVQIEYLFHARAHQKDVEAGGQKESRQSFEYDLGFSYRKQLFIKEIKFSFTKSVSAGYLAGAHFAAEFDSHTPEEQSDIDLKTGAIGGGIYVAFDVGKMHLEGSGGVHYMQSVNNTYIDSFSQDGRELSRTFGLGFGVSIGHLF
jgi:hypothetical protein